MTFYISIKLLSTTLIAEPLLLISELFKNKQLLILILLIFLNDIAEFITVLLPRKSKLEISISLKFVKLNILLRICKLLDDGSIVYNSRTALVMFT